MKSLNLLPREDFIDESIDGWDHEHRCGRASHCQVARALVLHGDGGCDCDYFFVGFAPTYYLRTYFGTQPLAPLLHLHGLIFTSWLLLFLTQTALVAAKRTDIHRRLGIVGTVVAMLMVVVGTLTAIIRAKQAAVSSGEVAPLIFLTIPLTDMLCFRV